MDILIKEKLAGIVVDWIFNWNKAIELYAKV